MAYKGSVELKASEIKRQTITGVTTAGHTLNWTPVSEQALIVTINGVKQHDSAYTISGTTLTLDAALVATDELEVIGLMDVGRPFTPADGSVIDSHLSASAAIAKTKLAPLDVVNADVNASAAITTSKLSGAVTGIASHGLATSATTDTTSASNISSGTLNSARMGSGSASSTTVLYGDGTWKAEPVTNTSVIENNIAMLAFKLASGDSLTKFSMVDQVVDDFADSTGIDTGNSTSVLRQSGYATGGATDTALKVLLHFDEAANNATTITPTVGPGNFTAGNNAKVHNGSAKFGTMSGRYQSSTNQYIACDSTADFDFGSGDFTIDFWINFNGVGLGGGSANSMLQIGFSNTSEFWSILAGSGTGISLRIRDSGETVRDVSASHTWVTTAGTWTHVMVTKASSRVYLFINGTLLNAGGTAHAHTIKAAGTSSELRLATDSAGDWDTNFDGYIDELRIRKGAASYTSTFTPETSAYGTTTTGANMTLVSTSTTAEATATTGDLVLLIEDSVGTASLGTDIKGYISRNGNANYSTAVTWVDEGNWGTNKRIITARGVALGALAGTTDMRYKITTHNQGVASKETLVHAVSLGWS